MSGPRKRPKLRGEGAAPQDGSTANEAVEACQPSNRNGTPDESFVADGDAAGDPEHASIDVRTTGVIPIPRTDRLPEAEGETSAEQPEDAPASSADVDRPALKRALESLIFVSDRVVTAIQLARAVKSRSGLVRDLVAELQREYAGRGIELVEVNGGYQFRSAPAAAAYVREFVAQKPVRLTRAQLETLALIAYRQPVTRPEIDEIRGVDSGSALRVLLERSLIKMLGRKDEPGRPVLYGTSPDFLEFFGLRSLHELPTLREFTELSQENRALFKRKTGEEVADAEAELAAAEEAERAGEDAAEHVSDEALAALAEAEAAQERRSEAEGKERSSTEGDDANAN